MRTNQLRRGIGATALVLISALVTSRAALADSSDCCTDLEARIAELEETTARKGNRKVSLAISGWVNEALFAWDDGVEQNAYIGTNFVEQSRFKFVGEAKINKEWSAGYILEVGVQGHPSNRWDQDNISSQHPSPANSEFALNLRKSNWFLKSSRLGQLAVGLNGMATYHLLDDADPTLTRNVNDVEGAGVFLAAFKLRHDGEFIGNLRWTDVLRGIANSTPGDGLRRDIVRYDTPEWHGFSGAASIGGTYLGDVMLNYKGDIGDFSVVARGGYGWSNDPGSLQESDIGTFVPDGTPCISASTNLTSLPNFHCRWGGIASTIMHNPTGLFAIRRLGNHHHDHRPRVSGRHRFRVDQQHVLPAARHRAEVELRWVRRTSSANTAVTIPAPPPGARSRPMSIPGKPAPSRRSTMPT